MQHTIKPEANTPEEQIEAMISQITDVGPFIIECCQFSKDELSYLFHKAVGYHNSLAEANEELQTLRATRKEPWPGQYSLDVTTEGFTANAMKITQRMTHIENRLDRLAESIRLRAQLKMQQAAALSK